MNEQNEIVPAIQCEGVRITRKGAVIVEGQKPSSEDIISLLKQLGQAQTACDFAVGDLTNYLIGTSGQDLLEIARLANFAAGDLRKRSNTCARIGYDLRDAQLHFDFYAEAAKSKADDPVRLLKMAEDEKLTRKLMKKTVELDELATDEDLKPVIEENDQGTENFHPFINKIVMLHGKFERDGVFARKSPDQLFGIHRDFMPVVRIWSGILDSLKSGLSPELQGELKRDFRELGFV